MASKVNGDFENMILNVPARQVLHNFNVLKNICLMLNRQDTLTNWKDVAGNLGFTNDEIFGHFIMKASPAEAVLTEWMLLRKGELGTLIESFQQNEMFSCLDELQGAIEEYKKQLYKTPDQENGSCEDEKDSKDKEGENKISQPDIDSNNSVVTETECYGEQCIPTANKAEQKMQDDKKPSEEDEEFNKVSSRQCPKACSSGINSNCDSVNKSPELIRWIDHYESEPSNIENFKNEFSTQKSPNLLKKLFFGRSLSSDPNINSKKAFNDKTSKSYRRSNSETLPNTIKVAEKMQKKKSQSFRNILHSKIFKGKKPPEKILCCDRPCVPSSVQSPQTSRVSNCTNSCSDNSDQAGRSVDCQTQTIQSSAKEKLPNSVQQQNRTDKDLHEEDASCLLRPASSSSEESIQNPAAVDSGFSSTEESKRVFIIHGKDKYKEAKELYLSFQSNSHYDCHMEAVNSLKVAEDKPLYIMKEIKGCDFVVICVSPLLKEIFEADMKEANDLSLTFAGNLIRGDIYSSGKNPRGKFMTVLTAGSSRDDIPFFMHSYEYYVWPDDKKKMENIIEGKPEFVPPPISTVRNEPKPRKIVPPTFS